jgi:Tfp pilus assembly protein PilN
MTQDSLLLRSSLATLPRVNLLPPEIEEARRFRQVQVGLGAAVLAAVGVVGLLVVSAGHRVTSAQERVDASQATNTRLTAEKARYADVTAVYARAAAAKAMLTQAMGDEVRFSQLLNDLSMSVPANVWVASVSYSSTAPGSAPVGSTASVIGSLSVQGIGYTHDDVAVWLESLASQKNYANPYFSSSAEGKLGTKPIVNFSSTAGITSTALSHRYDKAGS